MSDDWLPIPDHVARALGRVVFYAAHVEDVFSEAVVLGTPGATQLAETTPDWAESGSRLIRAVRAIDPHEGLQFIADNLERATDMRNQLVHGVWLWQAEHVVVSKRLRGKGERMYVMGKYTYEDIEKLVSLYQVLGKAADALVKSLQSGAGTISDDELDSMTPPNCPTDLVPMELDDGEPPRWVCPECGLVRLF